MKTSKMDVQELNIEETRKINGGFFGLDDLVIGIVVGAAIAVMNDWENFKAGLSGKLPVEE
jgi:hypothetical protein